MKFLKWLPLVTASLCAGTPAASQGTSPSIRRWALSYSGKQLLAALRDYDLVVLDSDAQPRVVRSAGNRQVLLGYLSIGEAHHSRSWFAKTEAYRLKTNSNWPDAWQLDIRNPEWARLLVAEIAPAILARGYDGFFLDTIDTAMELERADPVRCRGMRQAAADIVRQLRRSFPRAVIAMNRGFDIAPEIGSIIDYVLAESVYHTWNFQTHQYVRTSADTYASQLQLLKTLAHDFPGLQILTLDYCDPGELSRVREIYRVQRPNGFVPYVSTIDLTSIHPEPRR